jgi:outer membrane receptor protein involved in Fe transport
MTGFKRLSCAMLAGSASALALCASSAAMAADGAAAAESPTTVDELIVTADKRAQSLQVVPASVSAVSGEKLQELGVGQLSDLTALLPGFNISDLGSPGQTIVTLRGIAPLGSGAVVGTYIDDTPLGSSGAYARATIFALDLMPYDVERFEVLRGPQGTLYGASTMGGLIKYVMRNADPKEIDVRLGAETSVINEAGSPGYGLRGAVNVPIVEDKLALRGSVFNSYDPGYIDNLFPAGPRGGQTAEDTNTVHQWGGRVAATWLPIPNLEIQAQAMWQRTKTGDNSQVFLGNLGFQTVGSGANAFSIVRGDPVLGELTQSHTFLQPFTKNIDYYSATVNWDAGPVQVVSATSYSRTHTRQFQDATDAFGVYPTFFGYPAGIGYFDLNLDLDKFTQEFRISSPADQRLAWILGAFYTREDSDNSQLAIVLDQNAQVIPDPVFDPFFAVAALPSTYREYAVFGDLTFNVTEQFDITGGLRYAKNDQDFAQISDGFILGGFTSIEGESSEDVLTWMVNARYRFTPDIMAYARVASGYRPGGPNVQFVGANLAPTFDADTLISYEAGVRATFWDGKAVLNATAFNIDWENIQIGIANADQTVSGLGNGGKAFSRGFEVEGVVQPIAGLRLGFNLAYTKAELTENLNDPNSSQFVLNTQLPEVPEWTGAIIADYGWEVGDGWQLNVGGNVNFVDDSLAAAPLMAAPGGPLDVVTENPSYARLDLRAGIGRENWKFNVFARNVTDERVYREGFFRANIDAVPLQPRTIGVSLDLDF